MRRRENCLPARDSPPVLWRCSVPLKSEAEGEGEERERERERERRVAGPVQGRIRRISNVVALSLRFVSSFSASELSNRLSPSVITAFTPHPLLEAIAMGDRRRERGTTDRRFNFHARALVDRDLVSL